MGFVPRYGDGFDTKPVYLEEYEAAGQEVIMFLHVSKKGSPHYLRQAGGKPLESETVQQPPVNFEAVSHDGESPESVLIP